MKVASFARSTVALLMIGVGMPWLLIRSAAWRFDGNTPWYGVPAPSTWRWSRIEPALTNRLTEATIADVVVRVSLVVAWVAIITVVVTVFAELGHMSRHHGLPMPDIRGLGLSQRVARVIATGLLVVIPMVGSSSRVVASDASTLVPLPRAAASYVMTLDPNPAAVSAAPRPLGREVAHGTAPAEMEIKVGVESVEYVVKAGDSIYGIAGRLAGPTAADVADYAERLLDLNMGRTMPEGQLFNNAAYIDVGWTLLLPTDGGSWESQAVMANPNTEPGAVNHVASHVVDRNESLWTIAAEDLGDGQRWHEVFAANEGRTFADGRTLNDPDVIQPGWDLVIPGPDAATDAAGAVPAHTETEWSGVDQPMSADPAPSESLPISSATDTTVADSSVADRSEADPVLDVLLDVSELPVGAAGELGDDDLESSVESTDSDEFANAAAVNTWQNDPLTTTTTTSSPDNDESPSETGVQLITLERAAMLAGGVLLLLAARRRQQLRAARPRARIPTPAPATVSVERQLRAVGGGERFARVDIAVRAAAPALMARGAQVAAVLISNDGSIELWATGPVSLLPPWRGIGDRWSLPGDTPLEALAAEARRVIAPCPTLVQMGVQRGSGRNGDRDVYVDLEAIGAIEVGGTGAQADAIVAAVASTLASSVLAEVTTLVGLGVPDEAFLGHRLHVGAHDAASAYAAVAEAIGSTAHQTSSTFDLRSRATGGDSWEPAVLLVASSVGEVVGPTVSRGLALVSGAAIIGPSSRFAPDGDAWLLKPLGLRFVPIGLTGIDLASVVELVEPALLQDFEPSLADVLSDHTIVGAEDRVWNGELAALASYHDGGAMGTDEPFDETVIVERPDRQAEARSKSAYGILVRLIGPIGVETPDGESVEFERSKTKELLAWMVTHRERSTRTLARTALWDLDVRDATFANVVSEARRSLARLVQPPDGEEWVGRTLSEALPLHAGVRSDADVIRAALEAARIQPPSQAIATLTPAVELIRGMPFEGVSYLWPDPEGIVSNLVLLATSAAAELAAHCLSIGDVEGVFAATSRGLAVLSGHEELIGLRMRAHGDAGDLAGVRLEWESYSRALLADPWSDGEPSPKLVSLRGELLSPAG